MSLESKHSLYTYRMYKTSRIYKDPESAINCFYIYDSIKMKCWENLQMNQISQMHCKGLNKHLS